MRIIRFGGWVKVLRDDLPQTFADMKLSVFVDCDEAYSVLGQGSAGD